MLAVFVTFCHRNSASKGIVQLSIGRHFCITPFYVTNIVQSALDMKTSNINNRITELREHLRATLFVSSFLLSYCLNCNTRNTCSLSRLRSYELLAKMKQILCPQIWRFKDLSFLPRCWKLHTVVLKWRSMPSLQFRFSISFFQNSFRFTCNLPTNNFLPSTLVYVPPSTIGYNS